MLRGVMGTVRIRWNARNGLRPLGPGVGVPAKFSAAFTQFDDWPDLELDIVLRRDRLVVAGLRCEGEITGAMLRRLRIQDMLRFAAREALVEVNRSGALRALTNPKPLAGRHPTKDVLRAVAVLYRFAYAVGDPPAASVAANFGLPRSTAGRWIQLARSQGLLGKAEPRKAGEVAHGVDGQIAGEPAPRKRKKKR
jgi:hypothetical protein